jgi:hypothetical protein
VSSKAVLGQRRQGDIFVREGCFTSLSREGAMGIRQSEACFLERDRGKTCRMRWSKERLVRSRWGGLSVGSSMGKRSRLVRKARCSDAVQ